MNCPRCKHDCTRVIDTKNSSHHIRRYRLCRKCGFGFPTVETHDLGEKGAGLRGAAVTNHAVDPQSAEPEPTPAEPTADQRRTRFRASYADIPAGTTTHAANLVLEWWNSSRWARHGRRAAWTEEAFKGSAARVATLPPQRQLELAQAGVEAGWMALKPEYLGDKPRRLSADQFAPTDPQLVEALNGAF